MSVIIDPKIAAQNVKDLVRFYILEIDMSRMRNFQPGDAALVLGHEWHFLWKLRKEPLKFCSSISTNKQINTNDQTDTQAKLVFESFLIENFHVQNLAKLSQNFGKTLAPIFRS